MTVGKQEITRSCVVCRQKSDKSKLLKICYDNEWFFDFSQVYSGRSLYTHCSDKCLNNKNFEKGFLRSVEKLKSEQRLPMDIKLPSVQSALEVGLVRIEKFKNIGINGRKISWGMSRSEELKNILSQIYSVKDTGRDNNNGNQKRKIRL